MTIKQQWAVITLCCAAMIVGCDDDEPKKPVEGGEMGGAAGEMGGAAGEMGGAAGEMGGAAGEMGGAAGEMGGEMGGVTGGEMGGEMGGVTGGEMGGEMGGVTGGEMGGTVVPPSFCERYVETCGEWMAETSCEEWYSEAPAGEMGAASGASQACYSYHLGVAESTEGDERTLHCTHAAGAAPCVDELPPRYTVAYGTFATLNMNDPAVMGTAQLVRDLESGTSHAQLYAYGLSADTTYNAHVHALPCEFAGGGHYVLDPNVEGVVESNEVWPSFTTSAEGVGRADVSVASLLRGDAMSIVIHNPDGGAKLACADLRLRAEGSFELQGTFAPFEDAEEVDAMIAGDVTVTVGADSTINLNLNGLAEATEYKAHVHALPCAVNLGGGHYKIDPTNAETVAENEVWPSVEPVDGASSTSLTTLHVLRSDAQSIVIHRVTMDGAPKVACADLTRQAYEPAVRGASSPIVFLNEAGDLANSAAGNATLEISTAGSSTVTVSVTGFGAETNYNAHLHNEVCEVSQGGGHYLIDPSVTETIESNELWPSFTTTAEGAAEVSVSADHVVRPEAQSVVIHGNGGRVACLPLY